LKVCLFFPVGQGIHGCSGTTVPNGTKVPGTGYQLDPVRGAFNIGAMIRWLDYNDCWLAAEWGHPSDNLGAILAVTDWLSRTNKAKGKAGVKMSEVLTAMIQAHEVPLVPRLVLTNGRFKDVLLWKTVSMPLASITLSLSRSPQLP